MTNEEIIMKSRMEFMKKGWIKKACTFSTLGENGNLIEEPYPEQIHTRNQWWEKGRKIRDGEKGFMIPLWGKSGFRYYTYKAKFFAESQTEPIDGSEP